MAADHPTPEPPPVPARRSSFPWALVLGAALLAAIGAVVAGVIRHRMGVPIAPPPPPTPTTAKPHEVVIRKPAGPPVVHTGLTESDGTPVTIACATCHATKEPNAQARLGVDLPTFHQGLKGAHGNLACVSCHNPDEKYGSLRLADGTPLPYPEVMQLCAQCHGPQYRDYRHGAHGGMAGYWDLTKGPRVRNNCVDCHDPHSPKYPTVRPMPGPRDRGSVKQGAAHE